MEVHVIRHTPVAVEKSICYGQLDVALASSFKQDADLIKSRIPQGIEQVYASPLSRCKQLVDYLDLKPIQFENALMEINFGNWEGKAWNDIPKEELNEWMHDFVNICPPNGENLQMLYNRVQHFLDQLAQQPHEKVLLVCHAGVIRCMWTYLLDIPLVNMMKIPVGFFELFSFKLSKDKRYSKIKSKA